MPCDENIVKSIKVNDFLKVGLFLYVSFVLHASIIEKGWIDATSL